ncbi:MAG: RDD family protein [Longimicrobiales bacterium]
MDRRHDPRTIVTPYAFSVHPELLGRPLATPWQRLGAISLDLVVIFGLSRIGGTTLAVASGILLLWLAVKKPAKDALGWAFRGFVGCLGVTILGFTVFAVLGLQYLERLENDPEAQAELRNRISEIADSAGLDLDIAVEGSTGTIRLDELADLVPNLLALRNAENGAEALEIARSVATTAREGGVPLQEVRRSLRASMPDDAPWSGEADEIVDEVMADLRSGASGAAPRQGTPGIASRPEAVISDSLALDSIATLSGLVATLDEELQDAEAELTRTRIQLQEEESRGLLDWFRDFIDEIGLGFGWAALYLTLTHAWWKGRSIGKKIFRTRVVMIDNRPLSLWLSFERAGGYAAGFATGLLGFAQIFWDPNRQAIHDKVSETFVIQDGKVPVPGPWIAEGKAQWHRGNAPEQGRGIG